MCPTNTEGSGRRCTLVLALSGFYWVSLGAYAPRAARIGRWRGWQSEGKVLPDVTLGAIIQIRPSNVLFERGHEAQITLIYSG